VVHVLILWTFWIIPVLARLLILVITAKLKCYVKVRRHVKMEELVLMLVTFLVTLVLARIRMKVLIVKTLFLVLKRHVKTLVLVLTPVLVFPITSVHVHPPTPEPTAKPSSHVQVHPVKTQDPVQTALISAASPAVVPLHSPVPSVKLKFHAPPTHVKTLVTV
jgi:hypothetical protein